MAASLPYNSPLDVYLNAINYYLPEQIVTNESLAEQFPEWSVEKIAKKTGISSRHKAGPDEFSSDLAVAAAEQLFDSEADWLDRSSIDFVLFCTQSPDYFLPTSACIIQNRLGLSTSCGALDFNLGCSGYVYGLGLAKGLLASGQASRILFLTGETYSKFVGSRDKSSLTIFGDGGTASVLSTEPKGMRVEEFAYSTDGSGYDKLIVRQGGMRNPVRNHETSTDSYGNERAPADLQMDGRGIFAFTLTEVPAIIQRLYDRSNTTSTDYKHYVFHQANRFMLNHLRKKIKLSEKQMIIDMQSSGNTVSSTIPIALMTLFEKGKLDTDDQVMLVGFGVGLSLGACRLTAV